jgi:hypothetical protein
MKGLEVKKPAAPDILPAPLVKVYSQELQREKGYDNY